jgi:hypothetical protein
LTNPTPNNTSCPFNLSKRLATPNSEPFPPPLPKGYEIISDTFVHLSFALPEDWTRISGTKPGGVFVEYGPSSPKNYPTFRAGADASPGSILSDVEILSPAISAAKANKNYTIIKMFETTIARQHAFAIEYSLTRSPDEAYFSIIAATVGPDCRGYVLQWTATTANETQVRELFDNMFPFFQFLQ